MEALSEIACRWQGGGEGYRLMGLSSAGDVYRSEARAIFLAMAMLTGLDR
jgi:hypothetical protein